MPLTATLIVGGVAALAKTGFGIGQYASAKKAQANLKRPVYNIPTEWYDNDNLSANMAQHGLTEQALTYYGDQSNRGLSAGIGGILQGGGNINTISKLYDTYNEGNAKVMAEDAQLKNQNMMNYINSHAALANEKEKAWTLNYYEPYKDKSKANAAQMNAGAQTAWSGVDDAVGAASAYATGKLYQEGGATRIPRTTDMAPAQAAPYSIGTQVLHPDLFSGQGGQDAFKQLSEVNINSPYIQGLIRSAQAHANRPL